MRYLGKFIETNDEAALKKFFSAHEFDSNNYIATRICAALFQLSGQSTKLNTTIKTILKMLFEYFGQGATSLLIKYVTANFINFKLAKGYKKYIQLESDDLAAVYYKLKYTNDIPTFESNTYWSGVSNYTETPMLLTRFDGTSIDFIKVVNQFADFDTFATAFANHFSAIYSTHENYKYTISKTQYLKFIDLNLKKVYTETFNSIIKNQPIILEFVENFGLYEHLYPNSKYSDFMHNFQQLTILPHTINSKII